jgi:hypothetical protein
LSWEKHDLSYIPNFGVNIDTSVNVAFTADKMNAAKTYADITDC